MRKWVLKAIVQKLISFLPASHKFNFWFQKYITKGVRLSDEYFQDKLNHAHDHLRYLRAGDAPHHFNSLELGTGWYPVVPIAMYLSGARNVVSIDLNQLMQVEGLRETVQKYQDWLKAGKLERFSPFFTEKRKGQLLQLKSETMGFNELCLALELDYRVGDARKLEDPDETYDLIHSNNVFEHVYPEALEQILLEFKRVLKKPGMMSHFIDMSDHFAHLDSGITIYNFLRYSRAQWSRIDNSVQPQNRWRLKDYEELYARLDLKISAKEVRKGDLLALQSIQVHADYQGYQAEELAVSHAHLVNRLEHAEH